MKKFFTLIACALVAGSAFAQDEYKAPVELIKNGTIKYNVKAKEDLSKYPEAQLASFVARDWTAGENQTQGAPTVVPVPEDAATWENDPDSRNLLNYCLKVVSRDVNDAEGALVPATGWDGNAITEAQDWDTQFFIQLGQPMKEGDKFTFKMKIKAVNEEGIDTQTHKGSCGAYIHYAFAGSPTFTTEWEEYTYEGTISGSQDGGDIIAFNMAKTRKANTFYIDDISFMYEEKILPDDYVDMNAIDWENATWLNLVWNGNCAAEESSSLVCRESGKADYFNRVEGGNGTKYGVAITTVDNASEEWDTQFFITTSHVFQKNEHFKVAFDYRADIDASEIATQAHNTPGAYNHYVGIGNINFTTEWQHFESEVTVSSDMAKNGGMQSIAFNLNKPKDVINTFYFDNVEMYVAEEVASAEEKQEAADIIAAKVEDTVVTAINSAKAAKTAKTIYNVAGQQLKSLQKGLNIVNGEKVYVK